MIAKTNLLHTRRGRFIAFGTLYISQGIPFAFAAEALVMFMRMEGLSLELIGAFAAAQMLPWGFKWAWAPIVDIVKLNRFGGRKAWIVLCTGMMIVTLVVLAMVDFAEHYRLLLWMVVLNNLFGATQDVAIDSLAISTLQEDERGRGNGFMFGGQYLGLALGGGGAIYASVLWGFNASLLYVSGLLVLSLLFVLFFIRDPDAVAWDGAPESRRVAFFVEKVKAFAENLRIGFLQSGRGPKLGVVLAILPVGAMALGYAMLATIQVDYGLSQTAIARISILSTVLGGVGCIVGGWMGDRYGLKKMIFTYYALTAVPTVYLAAKIALLGLTGVSVADFYAVIILHSFLFGGAFALQVAIFMGMTNPLVAATQFTAYMAFSNLSVSAGNLWQGAAAERLGYSTTLFLDAALVVLALGLIPFLENREEKVEPVVPELEPAPARA